MGRLWSVSYCRCHRGCYLIWVNAIGRPIAFCTLFFIGNFSSPTLSLAASAKPVIFKARPAFSVISRRCRSLVPA